MTTRLFALVALLASGTASAEYSLAPWVQYLLGASAHNIAVSDINGDDRQDIVVTTGNGGNADAYKVQIFYQQQDGSLSAPEKISFGTTSGGDNAALVVEDLNGDRKPDILVGHAAGVTVFLRACVLGGSSAGTSRSAGQRRPSRLLTSIATETWMSSAMATRPVYSSTLVMAADDLHGRHHCPEPLGGQRA